MPVHCAKQNQKARTAFTLIEVLVCLVIIAVFAGAVSVSLKGRNQARALEMDARAVQGAIQFSVREAKLLQVPHRLQILLNGQAFQILRQNQGGGEGDFSPCEGMAGRVKSLSTGVRFLGTTERLHMPFGVMPGYLEFEAESGGFIGVVGIGFGDSNFRAIQVAPVTRQVFLEP